MLSEASSHSMKIGKNSPLASSKLPKSLIEEVGGSRDIKRNGATMNTSSFVINRDSARLEHRVNLIHLCKDRNLSEVDRKPVQKEISSTRTSENSTQGSSTNKDSWFSSPVMSSILSNENIISEDPKESYLAETKFTLTTPTEKRVKYFCQASYKARPKMGQLPSLNF